jgi:hypothetical protein
LLLCAGDERIWIDPWPDKDIQQVGLCETDEEEHLKEAEVFAN